MCVYSLLYTCPVKHVIVTYMYVMAASAVSGLYNHEKGGRKNGPGPL